MSDESLQLAWQRGAQGRARLLEARRRRRRRAFAALALLSAFGIAGVAAWVWLPRDTERTAQPGLLPPEISLEPRSPFVAAPTCRTPLTDDDPLRIWIGGDSLAGSLGPALGELTADTGVALPTYDYRTSSGLSSPSFFDWPVKAADEMDRVHPEVVVFIIGANDTGVVRSTPVGVDGEPVWRTRYSQLVSTMLDVLAADGRAVYWVGSPTLRDEEKNDGARQVNDVAREVVTQRDRATYIDAYKLFSDSRGDYTPTLRGSNDKDVRVRTSDGIHFTPAGGDLLAAYVFAYLDKRCDLSEQAVEGRHQPVRQSPGSGEVQRSGGGPPATSASTSTSAATTTSSTSTTTTTVPPVTTTTL